MKMEIYKKKIDGFVELVPETYEDERGFLAPLYNEKVFRELGFPTRWVEEGHHHTRRKYTLRGLHVSLPPFSESKLLRVTKGEMLWVAVDVRKDSKTFGAWDSVVLSETRRNLLLATPGFAHGCLSLTDSVDLVFKSDNNFSETHGTGIIWNDPDLNIDWNLGDAIPFVSERDTGYSSFAVFKSNHE